MLEWLIPVIAYEVVTIVSLVPNLFIQAARLFASIESALIADAGIRASVQYACPRKALVWGFVLLNHRHSKLIRAIALTVPVLLCVTGQFLWNEAFIPPGVSHFPFSYVPILGGHLFVTAIGYYYGIRNGKSRLRSEEDPVEVAMEVIRRCEQPPVRESYLSDKQALLARTDAVAEVFRAAYRRLEEESAAK